MNKLFWIFILLFQTVMAQKKVSTEGYFQEAETKSGFQINEYYVQLPLKTVQTYFGKKVKVSGKLVVIPAINPKDTLIVQGSNSDRYFIENPKIVVLEN